MRLLVLLAAALCLVSPHAMAFDLDGFFGGMPEADTLRKLASAGIAPILSPKLGGTSEPDILEGGVYTIAFCKNKKLASVTKDLDVREFNNYFVSMIKNDGQPAIDIPSLDADVMYLRWKLNDGSDWALNSGVSDLTHKRFHNVTVIDNAFCN